MADSFFDSPLEFGSAPMGRAARPPRDQGPTSIVNFQGNAPLCSMLDQMAATGRIPQALLFSGPEGIGKATLARRFAAVLLDETAKIEADDLALPENKERIEERMSLASDKRADDPLFFATHPDFLTFPPEGPLHQISIQQIRLLKEHAQFAPNRGKRRVFLIDELDRANEQAANSLLKILEEPPPYLLLIATVTNSFDILPTIRSRSVMFTLNRLPDKDVEDFLLARGVPAKEASERARLATGCPGLAATMDLAARRRHAEAMLTLLEVAAGRKPFTEWVRISEASVAKKTERLEPYLETLLTLLQDLLHLRAGGPLMRFPEYRSSLEGIAGRTDLQWVKRASDKAEQTQRFIRRNAQKTAALDDMAMELFQASLAR